MTIHTLQHDYYVIHKLYENPEIEAFLCVNGSGEGGENRSVNPLQNRFRVCRIRSRELTYQLVPVFTELRQRTELSDYFDCFSKDGFLYLVFLHPEDPSLVRKLETERCGLKERLEIGKSLLERILLLNIPDFILYDSLDGENVTVAPTLEVHFHYPMNNIGRYNQIGKNDVKLKLCCLYEKLFSYELEREISTDIDQFMKTIKTQELKNYFELYQSYEALYEKFNSGDLILNGKPNTSSFRLWDRIKGLGKYVKPVLAAALITAIAAYLVYSILYKKAEVTTAFHYDQIGTVQIEGQD